YVKFMLQEIKTKLRNISILKNAYRKTRVFTNSFQDFVLVIYYKTVNKKIIYSYFARVNNFGDMFNYDLINFFGFKLIHTTNEAKSNVALLGSILQMYTREFEGFILGSGFIDKRFNRNNNKWKIELIRGPLS